MDTAALSRHTKSLDSQVVGLQNTAERTQVGDAAGLCLHECTVLALSLHCMFF